VNGDKTNSLLLSIKTGKTNLSVSKIKLDVGVKKACLNNGQLRMIEIKIPLVAKHVALKTY
jgi:hypothetical protein